MFLFITRYVIKRFILAKTKVETLLCISLCFLSRNPYYNIRIQVMMFWKIHTDTPTHIHTHTHTQTHRHTHTYIYIYNIEIYIYI